MVQRHSPGVWMLTMHTDLPETAGFANLVRFSFECTCKLYNTRTFSTQTMYLMKTDKLLIRVNSLGFGNKDFRYFSIYIHGAPYQIPSLLIMSFGRIIIILTFGSEIWLFFIYYLSRVSRPSVIKKDKFKIYFGSEFFLITSNFIIIDPNQVSL